MSNPVDPPANDLTIHTVVSWRADSATLFQLRPFLAELQAMSMMPCEVRDHPDTCLSHPKDGFDPCWPCRLRQLWAQMEAATRRQP
jgi:hypothetical protein